MTYGEDAALALHETIYFTRAIAQRLLLETLSATAELVDIQTSMKTALK